MMMSIAARSSTIFPSWKHREYGSSTVIASPGWKRNRLKVFCVRKPEAPVLEKRSIEEVYDALVERLLPNVSIHAQHSKFLVGVAGPPGAGKSTVVSEVVRRLNKLGTTRSDVAISLPMDGFHLYRSQLDAMEDPKEAHARRGAPWTFNPEMLLECLLYLKEKGSVYAPSFDHCVGDPVEDDIFVSHQHKIVLVEGNYLFLDEGAWKDIKTMFDDKWFIDVNLDTAMERVVRRHIYTGLDPDVAKWRVEYNDRPNAELIMQTKKYADLVIRSVNGV